jgi:hypothetical protein
MSTPSLDDSAIMSTDQQAQLLFSFRKILRPLVRILIRAGVRFDVFCEAVKGVYVETAVRDGLGAFGKGTRAKISFVTAVTRRDVNRYIDDPSLLLAPRSAHSRVLTEVLHRWHTNLSYQGPYGVPLELDFNRRTGVSFTQMIREIDPTVDPAEILDELLQSGVVAGSAERSVKVLARVLVVPEPLSAQMLEQFSSAMADLANTLELNISGGDNSEKRLQRTVFADHGLPNRLLPQFNEFIRTQVARVIEDVDDWLGELRKENPSLDVEKPRVETGLTMFHYVRTNEPAPTLREIIGAD